MKVYSKPLFKDKYIGYHTLGLAIKNCTYELQDTTGNEPAPIVEKNLKD